LAVLQVLIISLFAMVLTAGGGHPDIEDVPLMDHLLISVVVAMAFFTPIVGLLVGLVNCFFMFLVFQFYPHGTDLVHHLSETYWAIVLPPLILHIFVTGVFFIIMRALGKEIKRADKAEELVQLRQSELEMREREVERSKQLEVGTHAILQTLSVTTSCDDFSQRVPLAQDNLLWRIAYSINNLLTYWVYEKVVGKQSKRWYPHLKEKNETERTPSNGNERKAQNSTASRDGKRVASDDRSPANS
jgi:hypothetical protein